MLIAARKIKQFTSGLTYETFRASQLHQSAVVRELQVIGEAARSISDEYRQAHESLPWDKISGLRNRIIHEYFRVDLEILWDIVTEDIAPLIQQVQGLIPPEDAEKDSDT